MARWMRVVGAIYVVLGIGFIPAVNEARVPLAFPFAEGFEQTQLFTAFIDYSFAFGLDLLVIGGFLIWAARRAGDFRWLIHLVVWLEAVRGVVGDVWVLTRGYPAANNYVWLGFIVFHLVVITTGVAVLRGSPPTDLERNDVSAPVASGSEPR